jgi:hypothetical protein
LDVQVKKLIAKIAQLTGASEEKTAQVLFGSFMLLSVVTIFNYFSQDEIDCTGDNSISLVQQIVNDANPFMRPESVSLSAIRTTERNDQLKRSTCAAQAAIKYPGIPSVAVPITYTLESTSDGVYGTVYGL